MGPGRTPTSVERLVVARSAYRAGHETNLECPSGGQAEDDYADGSTLEHLDT